MEMLTLVVGTAIMAFIVRSSNVAAQIGARSLNFAFYLVRKFAIPSTCRRCPLAFLSPFCGRIGSSSHKSELSKSQLFDFEVFGKSTVSINASPRRQMNAN